MPRRAHEDAVDWQRRAAGRAAASQIPMASSSRLEGRPVLRIDWPPDDLERGAEQTREDLARLGVPIERPRDLEAMIARLQRGVGPGGSPSIARDLVARRLVAVANRTLGTRGDRRKLHRVLSIGHDLPDAPTWVLVDHEERDALAAEGVRFEALGRTVALQLAPLVLGLVTLVLAVIALVRGERGWWLATMIAWGTWFVARVAARRVVRREPARPSVA